MNIRLLPDLAAMAVLLAILYFLRRRHPQEHVGLWIIGLLFIFIEAIAHAVYTPRGPWHIPSHIVALDSYLAAGVIFLWAAAKPLYPRRPTLAYLFVNTTPLAALLTIYGFDVRTPGPYRVAIVCGSILAAASPFLIVRTLKIGRAWWFIVPASADLGVCVVLGIRRSLSRCSLLPALCSVSCRSGDLPAQPSAQEPGEDLYRLRPYDLVACLSLPPVGHGPAAVH